MLADQPAVATASLAVHGRERVQQELRLPPAAEVLILAREFGIDVTLEVADGGGRVIAKSDNPIRRTGIQRVLLMTVPGAAVYVAAVTGKDQLSGHVELRAFLSSKAPSGDVCRDVQRELASADSAYASGQSITRSGRNETRTDAATWYRSAANAYATAAARLQRGQPSSLLATVQLATASVLYQDLQEWDSSYSWAEKSAQSYAHESDAYGQARAEAIQAAALMEIGLSRRAETANTARTDDSTERARRQLRQLAAFHAGRGELYDQALALNNIGLAHYYDGSYDDAIRAYDQALPLYERLNERIRQAQVLQNIALVNDELGRLTQALAIYGRVLKLVSFQDDPRLYLVVLNNLALAHWGTGEYDAALHEFDEGISLARQNQDQRREALANWGAGTVYDAVGDQGLALQFYRQAVDLSSARADVMGRTTSLRAISDLLRRQGRAAEALVIDQEVLSLVASPISRTRTLLRVASDLAALGRTAEAAHDLNQVIGDSAGNQLIRARALTVRATLPPRRAQYALARSDLREAARTFRAFDSSQDEFDAWIGIAQLARDHGDAKEAFAALDRGRALAEQVRTQSANPQMRATLLQPLRPAFDMTIAMLADRYLAMPTARNDRQGIALRALVTAEESRARALKDFQALDIDAEGLPPTVVARRRTVGTELAARRFQLAQVLDDSGPTDPKVKVIQSDIATLRRELDQIDARIGEASNAGGRRHTAQPGNIEFRRLARHVAVVEYWLTPDTAYAWVATQEGVSMTRLGTASEITDAARALHQTLLGLGRVPESDRLRASEHLFGLILAPLWERVSDKRTLVFVPDSVLHYIPFAALCRPGNGAAGRFLIQDYDVAVAPSLRTLIAVEPRTAPTRQLLLVADPVYSADDARIEDGQRKVVARSRESSTPTLFRGARDGQVLPRLPGTAREASLVAALVRASDVDRLEGFAATRDRFLGGNLERYRIIHVASHALTDAEAPQLSALVLSTVDRSGRPIEGHVLATDFVGVRLNADLVVLSACDTALGKNVAGEGLVGLQYVVLARGARAAISSLWEVVDQASASLMGSFYQLLLSEHQPTAAALSGAMRRMVAGPFHDPAYWAAFALVIGDNSPLGSM